MGISKIYRRIMCIIDKLDDYKQNACLHSTFSVGIHGTSQCLDLLCKINSESNMNMRYIRKILDFT